MGFFKKITEAERMEKLAQHLRSLGVEVESIEESKMQFRRIGAIGVIFSWKYVVKLAGQSIDGIVPAEHSTAMGGPAHYLHYVVFGMKQSPSVIKLKTEESKEHWYGGKVRGVKWVGGNLAQVLNSDMDLLQLQVQEGATKIEIIPDKKHDWIHIADPSYAIPSRNYFDVFDRIAQHIRSYSA